MVDLSSTASGVVLVPAPIVRWTQLWSLDLTSTPVSDLEPLVGMTSVTIVLDKKQQVTVPKELKGQVLRSR